MLVDYGDSQALQAEAVTATVATMATDTATADETETEEADFTPHSDPWFPDVLYNAPFSDEVCWSCNNVFPQKLQVCGGCHVARFCGHVCQQREWQSHAGHNAHECSQLHGCASPWMRMSWRRLRSHWREQVDLPPAQMCTLLDRDLWTMGVLSPGNGSRMLGTVDSASRTANQNSLSVLAVSASS